ncbi:4'-phosphopantetheinyl transferase family protein [Muriicola sp. Z0-33]|uniref:4'-phosphopantetheinyl transferase family protein n=1 Tax=Muriicola sp. Z0-33 TaxID=2816957 RepID=UPI0022388063|nr:4'-phosphopantetheinyl transferase superfamily protein [Muriicola sp. Z0-33]MCW5515227.1 4'-phosphopantetheinyl transferase superfamily protein [Muriicola sp. Z0-33]
MLSKNTIAVWTIDQRLIESVSLHQKHLSLAELDHAKKYRFDKDRYTFIIGRGILRHLLGHYTKQHPSEINFKFGDQGKPFIDDNKAPYFNISHSGNILVMGFCMEHPLGVDVELIKSDFDLAELARQNFSEKEIKALNSLNKNEQDRAFYRCWTRKESFIKAIGSGLSFPLDAFSVCLDDDLTAEMLETKWEKAERHQWKLSSFIPADGYLAAVCVQDKNVKIVHRNWKEIDN